MTEDDNNKESAMSNFSHLYKATGTPFDQYERRIKLLNEVKKRRNDAFDEIRGINDLFVDEQPQDEPMDVESRRKKRKSFGQKIMLSEWFTDVPPDLEDNWYVKLCPVGTRNIVVASNGITKVYNRQSKQKATFKSHLPGGGLDMSNRRLTVLDCIYNWNLRTYYILDVLAWNSTALIEHPAEFRLFFLRSKMDESPELAGGQVKFKFVCVDYSPAQLALIEDGLSRSFEIGGVELALDGVLFYHKDANYTSGLTPLVGWLKPYMVPEMLGIPVHASFMASTPKNYVSMRQYIEQIKSKRRKNDGENHGLLNVMETDDVDESSPTQSMED